MRRAFKASRLVASVVAHFLYLAFEEAMRAQARERRAHEVPKVPSVHEMPTLPGTVPAPLRDFDPPAPVIRVMTAERSEPATQSPTVAALADVMPAVLADPAPVSVSPRPSLDIDTLLDTLRRDVGCHPTKKTRSHDACRAAETLAAAVNKDAVLAALEETVSAAGRPDCVRISASKSLGKSSRAAARRALLRMLGVAKSRASWSGARADRDLVSVLLHALDA